MRLFLAVDLSARLRRSVETAQRELSRACSGWRWIRPDAIHLTLRFLGEVGEDRRHALDRGWRDVARDAESFTFGLEGIGVFPSRGSPRVLWLGVREDPDAGRLVTLARRVEAAARDAGFAPEARPFRPHLTIARARPDSRPEVPIAPPALPDDRVEARELVLFRSELRPGGAVYSRIAAYPLGSRGSTA